MVLEVIASKEIKIMEKKLVYDIQDKPPIGKIIVFALQQLLAIIAATILVPKLVGNGMSTSAALLGAGVGTLVYQLFTKFRSPVFLGSSFAFIGSMSAAFAGAYATKDIGYLGILIGAIFAGLMYVIIALIIKFVGVKWINKLMPPAVIGPTVALIGLSLATNAVRNSLSITDNAVVSPYPSSLNLWLSFICAMVTFFVVIICSTYGKKMVKLIPFIIGILAGYGLALIFTAIGHISGVEGFIIVNFQPFKDLVANGVNVSTFIEIPEFTFIKAFKDFKDFEWSYLATIAVAYIPVAFVVFAEHVADHKNLSTIIGKDLLDDPGLHRTLLGDGIGSMAGAFFGGCPNTTYGESVGCVAITRNASIVTITTTSIIAILISFLSPFVALLDTIPACVIMGGVCIALYGFIAVSGLKMIQKISLENSANLFTVSAILITGIGGMAFTIADKVTITPVACALILGIIVNIVLNIKKKDDDKENKE